MNMRQKVFNIIDEHVSIYNERVALKKAFNQLVEEDSMPKVKQDNPYTIVVDRRNRSLLIENSLGNPVNTVKFSEVSQAVLDKLNTIPHDTKLAFSGLDSLLDKEA